MIRDIQNIDDDIIRKKRLIGELLYNDPDIVELIDNKEIDPTCPDELMYNNIWPFIRIPGTQDQSKTFITYALDDNAEVTFNSAMTKQSLKIVIFVHKDLVKTQYGCDRHDLLGYIVRDIFNWANVLGMQAVLTSSREGSTD